MKLQTIVLGVLLLTGCGQPSSMSFQKMYIACAERGGFYRHGDGGWATCKDGTKVSKQDWSKLTLTEEYYSRL
jgi:hypothetical protein